MVRNIAAVALVAALLAAATAGAQAVIDGGDVRNNSLTGKDVKDKSLTRKDFKGSVRGPRGLPGARGPAGPQGAQGAPGAQGPAGAPGASGATNVTVRSGPVALGDSIASCNAGERAVGGGGISGDAGGYIWNSTPLQDAGQTPTAWTASAASAEDTTLDEPVNVQAWVICAAP
jgi:Collagen triple helix repeat (20 copies)